MKGVMLSEKIGITFLEKDGIMINGAKSQAKISSKGWVVIPASLRRKYGLKSGTTVEFAEEDGRIVITAKRADLIEELFGKLAGQTSLSAALLEDRAQELEREETRLRAG